MTESQIGELERRVRERARNQLRERITCQVDEVRNRFAGMTTDFALVDTARLPGLRTQHAPDEVAVEPVLVQINVKAARELFIAALLHERTQEEEQRAIDAVLATAEREVARG